MSASVVSGVDASPVLEAGEQVLDAMALLVEDRIVGVLNAVLGMGRDAGRYAPIDQGLAERRGTVGPVGKQETCVR